MLVSGLMPHKACFMGACQFSWSVLAVIDNEAMLLQLCSRRLVWSATAAVCKAAVDSSVLSE